MKFEEIARRLEGIPYTHVERGERLYHHILNTRPKLYY